VNTVEYPLYPADDAKGYLNIRTKEWHQMDKLNPSCNVIHIKDSVVLTWSEAKKRGADLCGREYKNLSSSKKHTCKKCVDLYF